MYLAYLDGDLPNAFTCDNFRDVARLEFEPHFQDYMQEAFKPLGVYVDFWQPALAAGTRRTYRVILVNDTQQASRGRLTLAWKSEQGDLAGEHAERAFEVPPAGRGTCELELPAPSREGRYVLTAAAAWEGQPWSPTLSRRKVTVTAAAEK